MTTQSEIRIKAVMSYRLFLIFFLASCGSEEYRPRQGGGEALLDLEFDDRARVYAQTCEAKGFAPNSAEFDQCVYEIASEYNLAQVRRDFYNQALD